MALPALALGASALAQPVLGWGVPAEPGVTHAGGAGTPGTFSTSRRGEQGWHEGYGVTTRPAQHRAQAQHTLRGQDTPIPGCTPLLGSPHPASRLAPALLAAGR